MPAGLAAAQRKNRLQVVIHGLGIAVRSPSHISLATAPALSSRTPVPNQFDLITHI